MFAISYLRVALNFKLYFSSPNCEQGQEKLRQRNKCINIFGLVFIIFTSLPVLIFPFKDLLKKTRVASTIIRSGTKAIYIMISYTVTTIILVFSIYRIRKYSKMLVQNKIFANECLMMSHLASFIFLGVISTISQFIEFSIALKH